MGLRGIVLGVAVLAGAIAAPGVPTADAMPANDLRDMYAKIFVLDIDLTGARQRALRLNQAPIDPEILTGSFDDDGDPPLLKPTSQGDVSPFSNCRSAAEVLADPTNPAQYAQRTVWYEITQDGFGAPFDQRTLVTVDTMNSNLSNSLTSSAAALEVFAGADVPPAFDRVAPVLPTNVVACDLISSTLPGPAVVSFVAQPGQRYFLIAGIAPGSPGSGGNLRLAMRLLDIQAPVVSISLNQPSNPSGVFRYTISSPGAVRKDPLVVEQKRPGKPVLKIRRALLTDCDDAHMMHRVGQYCTAGDVVRVRWRNVATPPPGQEFGTVSASYTDRAGNIGRNSLQTQLRDREPPRLSSNTTARWTRRGRLFVTATCFKGPGTIEVQVGAAKKHVQTIPLNSQTMRLKRAFPEVRRRTTFVHVICRDLSKNADDTWLFLPG
jgi:hypothetical protein